MTGTSVSQSGAETGGDPSAPTAASASNGPTSPTSDGDTDVDPEPEPTGGTSSPLTTTDPTTTFDSTGEQSEDIPPGSQIPVGGGDYFLLGANYPWKSYGGDFGGNGWGVYGVHTLPDAYAMQFQQMHDAGLQVVRWFVFTDGRAGIIFDNSGTPTGLDPHVLNDFEVAVAIARDHGVYLVPVLFDFHWMYWAKQDGPVQTGGHSDTITDPNKRTALLDNIVTPLLTAYANEPVILAWEIMNEPEWSISDLPDGTPTGEANSVPLADFYVLAAEISERVHSKTSAYVTLGAASLKWLKVWTPSFATAHQLPQLNLDFYQAHYYPWMDGQSFEDHPDFGTLKFSPFEQDYASLELDRPVVIGELVISANASQLLDDLVANGYAGAWPWSLNADYSLDLPGLKTWFDANTKIADLPNP